VGVSPRARSTLGVAGLFALLVLPRVAPATVAEQRARLPPPKACDDPVAGIWVSHQYAPRRGIWDQFTLTIGRDPADKKRLVGTIHNHVWAGGKEDEQPPPCEGNQDYVVVMSAEGEADGLTIRYDGLDWKVESQTCGGRVGYNIDHFVGTIDPALQEFQSLNNDGGEAVNEPTVFRRISCGDDGELAAGARPVVLTPPPFQPPSSGCGGLF
jgi:hypothetical protein